MGRTFGCRANLFHPLINWVNIINDRFCHCIRCFHYLFLLIICNAHHQLSLFVSSNYLNAHHQHCRVYTQIFIQHVLLESIYNAHLINHIFRKQLHFFVQSATCLFTYHFYHSSSMILKCLLTYHFFLFQLDVLGKLIMTVCLTRTVPNISNARINALLKNPAQTILIS